MALRPVVVSGHKLSLAVGFPTDVGMDSAYTRATASVVAAFVEEEARGAAFVYAQISSGRVLDISGTSKVASLDDNVVRALGSEIKVPFPVLALKLKSIA
jgi:hypothetical protein